GKLDALNARFRDHTCKLFEKHGITNVAYWVPPENQENTHDNLVYNATHNASEEHSEGNLADPDWQKVKKESEANGELVSKIESVLLGPRDYSPEIKPSKSGERIFELRIYTASKGNLDALNARFRDHTCKLFEKHGMTNVAYWVPQKDQKGAEDTLVYIVAHK